MWEWDCKESWMPKNWCFWIVVLENALESPLYCKEIQPVHPKENQSWVFIGRTDAEAETPILWPPDAKNWLIVKDPDAGKDWRQEDKGMTEDEMVGWHHQLSGLEFEYTPGVGDGQKDLACCSPWGLKELEMTEWLNWTEPKDNLIGRWKQMSVKMRPSVFSQVFIFCVKAKSKRGWQGSLFNFCSSLHPLVLKCLITYYPSKLSAFSQFPWCCLLALSSAQMISSSHKIFLITFFSFPEWRTKIFFMHHIN